LFSIYNQAAARIHLRLDVEKAFLDINRAIPCGLIINELVTNSLQHGFPAGKKGEIGVSLKVEKKGKFTLIVKDNGVGIPQKIDYRKTKTLGMQLVIDLVDQLEGTVELDRSKGTEFTISF
jgi:two-component sensor histidine kinase